MKTNKTLLLWWTVGLLLILNLVTIATVVYHTNYSEAQELIVLEPDTPPLNGRLFKQHLSFDTDQMAMYRKAHHLFQIKANEIIGEMEFLKKEMYKELITTTPNQQRIKAIATKIGLQHQKLKEETAHFYLTIKANCTPEQQQALQLLFKPLFQNTPNTTGGHCRRKACKQNDSLNKIKNTNP